VWDFLATALYVLIFWPSKLITQSVFNKKCYIVLHRPVEETNMLET
jgi:hypothetical protein